LPEQQHDAKRQGTIAKAIATVGGVGYSPIAPGTCGTAVTVPLAWLLAGTPWWGFIGITVAVTLLGIWAAGAADRAWGTHDSGRIVIDETAGYLATMTFVDRHRWQVLLVGFVIFRALDMIKPPPIRWIDEKMPGGAGVVLDDVAAGVMGAAIMVAIWSWR
jgi:phosphatidylglycerophosphatase A